MDEDLLEIVLESVRKVVAEPSLKMHRRGYDGATIGTKTKRGAADNVTCAYAFAENDSKYTLRG